MTYAVLKLAHVVGAIVIGAGLIGVWVCDLRSRQVRDLPAFAEAVRTIAVFYDGAVATATPTMRARKRTGRSRNCVKVERRC